MTDSALWRRAAADIHWYQAPATLLDDSDPPFYRWYPDGVTNACYNAVDLHVEQGRGGQLALIYDSPVTATRRSYSFGQLLDAVSASAPSTRWYSAALPAMNWRCVSTTRPPG